MEESKIGSKKTKQCLYCRFEIPSGVVKCPQCQKDSRNWFSRHPLLTLLGVLPVFAFWICIFSSGSEKQAMPENSPKPPMEIEMNVLVAAFDQNQLEAEQKLNGQFITTGGFITNISEDILGNPFASLKPTSDPYYFGTTLQCFPKDRNKNELMGFKNGEKIGVRGIVNGQSLGIIELKNCEAFK